MTCFYLRESVENNRFKLSYDYIFNKIKQKDRVIYLPIIGKKILNNKKAKKIANKLRENNVRLVALSNQLELQELLKNEMYLNDINILDGKYLFKMLSKNIIEFICEKSKKSLQNLEISLLINDIKALDSTIIIELAEVVKALNITTNNIDDFKNLEKRLFQEKGIVIKISNNKKKSLINSNVIFNYDFCGEDVNLYNIPQNGIIVNFYNVIKIKAKKFNGININGYNIMIPERYKMPYFKDEIVYESLIINMNHKEVQDRLLKDRIKIKNLLGENGAIKYGEFSKL